MADGSPSSRPQSPNQSPPPSSRPIASLPLSPHLSIWRWQVTMATSITHRATGIALYAGAVLLAVWFFAAALGREIYAPVAAVVASPLGLIILFGFGWSLMFHAMNGLRHLYWDAGRGLAPKTASMTAWLVYGASLVVTIVIFVAALTGGR